MLVVLGVLSVLLVTWFRKAETLTAIPTSATAISGPSPGPVSGPPASSSPGAETPRAKRPETAEAQPARLIVDLEHPLKTGRISIWADGELIFKETLDSRVTKKILALKLRKGSLRETVELSPRKHQIRVQVTWDDNERSEEISGTFKPGDTRRLKIRLGRLLKDLSLDWR